MSALCATAARSRSVAKPANGGRERLSSSSNLVEAFLSRRQFQTESAAESHTFTPLVLRPYDVVGDTLLSQRRIDSYTATGAVRLYLIGPPRYRAKEAGLPYPNGDSEVFYHMLRNQLGPPKLYSIPKHRLTGHGI